MKIQTEFDRLINKYGPPVKPPNTWKRIFPKPSTCIARTAKHPPVKRQSNARDFRVLKSVVPK